MTTPVLPAASSERERHRVIAVFVHGVVEQVREGESVGSFGFGG